MRRLWTFVALFTTLPTACGIIQATPPDWGTRLLDAADLPSLVSCAEQTVGGGQTTIRQIEFDEVAFGRLAPIDDAIRQSLGLQSDGGRVGQRRGAWLFRDESETAAVLVVDFGQMGSACTILACSRGDDATTAEQIVALTEERLRQ